jgi:hypothetical protein
MSVNRSLEAFKVAVTGATVTTTVNTSLSNTIPLTSAGTPPRFTRFIATGICWIRTRSGASTAVITDLMLTAGLPVILATGADTHYAVIDAGVAVTLNITPLEDS